jgi:hypothetical protein
VLDLTVSEALQFFSATTRGPACACSRSPTSASSTCASGSRCRRSRAAKRSASSSPRTGRNAAPGSLGKLRAGGEQAAARAERLFLFDEPTTGLHFDDIAKLLRAFRRLDRCGHSLLVVEHNLDVIRAADWIIDLGSRGR